MFVDQYTPTLLALIARDGVTDRDDVADVYLRVCERLAANGCERLRRHDARKGPLAAWLTVLVRHVVVDWIRSRAGRRRLFGAIRKLEPFDRRVFELYYWQQRRPSEIAGLLQTGQTTFTSRPEVGDTLRPGTARSTSVDLVDVLAALQRIQEAMNDRHRAELLSLVARTRPSMSLTDLTDDAGIAGRPSDDPEHALHRRELDELFASALAALAPEDAAIIRLIFVQGWSRQKVQRALHLESLTTGRVSAILGRLRSLLSARGIGGREAATPGLSFLEGDPS